MQLQARLGRGRAEGLRELSREAAWERGDQEMESESGFATHSHRGQVTLLRSSGSSSIKQGW